MARGDVWSASGALLGLNNLPFLNRSGPAEALARADEFMSHWSKEGYQLQHYWYFITRTHVHFFNGDHGLAHRHISEEWERLRRSMLLLVPSIRYEALYMRGHGCLEMAKTAQPSEASSLLRQARRDAAELARGKTAWPRVMSAVLRAGSSLVRGDLDRGVREMRQCIDALTALDMSMHTAAARMRLAGIVGGDEATALQAQAEAWAREQEISDLEALTRVLVP